MDLSLYTDSYSTAYLGHNHHLQAQQQQQEQFNLQHQYHQSQSPQGLSLAPPSGKGFYDLESLEHVSAPGATSNSLASGHMGAFTPYQADYGLSSYTAGAVTPASASAAALHQPIIPSQSPGQLWSRNSNSMHSGHVIATQHAQYSPLEGVVAPTVAAAYVLHPSGYNAESLSLGAGASANAAEHPTQYASVHGWAGADPQSSQWSQQSLDNCLPPGVEPTTSSVTSAMLPVHPHMHTQLQVQTHQHPHPHPHPQPQPHPQIQPHPHPHPHLHLVPHPHLHSHPHFFPHFQPQPQPHPQAHFQMQRHLHQQFPPIGHSRTGKKIWPKKKPARIVEKKVPPVKTTVMKEAGPLRGLAPENGPGWCFVCQRNCVTEVALKQHLEGKGHKRQAELQKERAELASKAVDEDGGGVATMLEQMWVQVSMMGKAGRVGKSKKRPKGERARRGAKLRAGTAAEPKAEGDECTDANPTDTESKVDEGMAEVKPTEEEKPPKVQEIARCELCGVECNSKAVLEFHFGGKKHAAKLKKLQESSVSYTAKPTMLPGQYPVAEPTLPGQYPGAEPTMLPGQYPAVEQTLLPGQ